MQRFRLRDVPETAAGAIVFAFGRPPNEKHAVVQLDALSAGGALTEPRWRRTYGRQTGTVFPALPPDCPPDFALHVCEGAIDGLAVATWRRQPAWATGGTAGMENPGIAITILATGRPVVIEADSDGPGWKAALTLQRNLMRLGLNPRICEWPGCDPAEGLAAEWNERAALLVSGGEIRREQAEAAAWKDLWPAL